MNRLTQSQWFFVLASVVFAIGAGVLYLGTAGDHAHEISRQTYQLCVDRLSARTPAALAACRHDGAQVWMIARRGIWLRAAEFALIPIPFAWIFILALPSMARRIRRSAKRPARRGSHA